LGKKETGPALVQALKKELQDTRTWSAKYHIILAIGHSGYDEALSFLEELATKAFEDTIIYLALGDSIFRLGIILKSTKEVLDGLYSTCNYGLIYGGFRALAMLKLVPGDEVITKIIEYARDPIAAEVVKGYPNDQTGLRLWPARASAGWKKELVSEFWDECDNLTDQSLKFSIELSRKGKYYNWRPY
jgi:hypothetical protein